MSTADLTEGSGPAAAALRKRLQALIPEGWIPVESSWIAAFRYHPDSESFDMQVKSGTVYPGYPNCPPVLFLDLLAATSHGEWMWRHYPPGRGKG